MKSNNITPETKAAIKRRARLNWRQNHPQEYRAEKRLWAKRHRMEINARNRKLQPRHRLRKRGISSVEYAQLLVSQEGCCAICRVPFTQGRYKTPNIDHDHVTGEIRGLLCNRCNQTLGMTRDSTILLQSAICYLNGKKSLDF